MEKRDQGAMAARMTALLEEKRELFEEYERETAALLDCDIDAEMESHMDRRQKLAVRIDELDGRIGELGQGDPRFAQAVRCRCQRGELPGELQAVFDAARSVFGVVARVQNCETQVLERMKSERDGLEKKIRETNRSQASQASRYFSGTVAGSGAMHADSFGKA